MAAEQLSLLGSYRFQTFTPIVAGIVTMDKKSFMFYNVVSSFLWSFTLIFAGHYLYGFLLENYQIDLKEHIEVIVIVLVIITLSVLLKFAKNAQNGRLNIKLVLKFVLFQLYANKKSVHFCERIF
jgi:hypothetical protein